MWRPKNLISQRTFVLLCVACFLMMYCGLQLFKIRDMTTYIDEYNEDLLIDKLVEEDIDLVTRINSSRPEGLDDIKHPIFQPNVSVEFPHIVNGTIKIPHIIHQICNILTVPDHFVDPMRTFVQHNPSWQYRFWTYDSGQKFLEKHHPYLVDIYVSFGENDVKKADLLRYAVLYEYGGVYSDLDVKNMRSLNKTTTKYACILPTEPFEHSGILYGREATMSNTVLLCRPKHPFYKQLLQNLQMADPKGHPVATTGPLFVTMNFLKYNNITTGDLAKSLHDIRSNTPYFYKGNLKDEDRDDGVYIPNSQYFMDNIDPSWFGENGELNACNEGPLSKAPVLKQRACKEFESRKRMREEQKYTFTFHYWFHLWSQGQDAMRRVHIKDINPTAILYNE